MSILLNGKIQALLDRLTAARAAKLDNLDQTVGSRAPGSTALSTATWTAARAAKLDKLDTAISDVVYKPAATGSFQSITTVIPIKSGGVDGSALVLNLTGRGVVLNLTVHDLDITTGAHPYMRVTVDGINVFGNVDPVALQFNAYNPAPLIAVPMLFEASFKLEFFNPNVGGTRTMSTLYSYFVRA